MTLVEFINARLDDDEAYARNAFGDHNDAGPDWREIWSGGLEVGSDVINVGDSQVSRFMERHDPARVLRDVERDRRIVEERQDAARLSETVAHGSGREWRAKLDALDMVLCLLALPYADHPDYDESWRP